MRPKRKQKNDNAVYCHKYRQKIQLKRSQSRTFDKKCRKSEATRKALYRTKKKQQQQQQLSVVSSSIVTTTRANLRKAEGLQRRRQNTANLKLEIDKLHKSNKQLQVENKELKARLTFLASSSQGTTTHSTTITSPSKVFFENLSSNAKRRATTRMMVQKPDLPRGSVV